MDTSRAIATVSLGVGADRLIMRSAGLKVGLLGITLVGSRNTLDLLDTVPDNGPNSWHVTKRVSRIMSCRGVFWCLHEKKWSPYGSTRVSQYGQFGSSRGFTEVPGPTNQWCDGRTDGQTANRHFSPEIDFPPYQKCLQLIYKHIIKFNHFAIPAPLSCNALVTKQEVSSCFKKHELPMKQLRCCC